MKVHRDLEITTDAGDSERLRERILDALPNGWAIDDGAAERIPGISGRASFVKRDPGAGKIGVEIMLYTEPGRIYVPNALRLDGEDFTEDEYNQALEEFCDECVRPALADTSASIRLGKTNEDLEDYMSARAAALLRTFSRSANPSTGSAHPRDQERWFDFVIAAHQERASLVSGVLHRLLVEDLGWSDNIASDLAIEYESERGILEHYDQIR